MSLLISILTSMRNLCVGSQSVRRPNICRKNLSLSLDPAMRSMLSANLRDYPRPPTAMVSTKSSSMQRLGLAPRKCRKDWRQDTIIFSEL